MRNPTIHTLLPRAQDESNFSNTFNNVLPTLEVIRGDDRILCLPPSLVFCLHRHDTTRAQEHFFGCQITETLTSGQ